MQAQAHVCCISLASGEHLSSLLVLLVLLVLQVLAPGLRMGWATAAPALLEKLIFQLHGSLLGPTSLSQARCTVVLPCCISPSTLPRAGSRYAAACQHLGASALRCLQSLHCSAAQQLQPRACRDVCVRRQAQHLLAANFQTLSDIYDVSAGQWCSRAWASWLQASTSAR